MFEVVEQSQRRSRSIARHVNSGSGYSANATPQFGKKIIEWNADFTEPTSKDTAAFSPGQHQEQNQRRDEQREPASVSNFEHVRAKKCEVDGDEERRDHQSCCGGPMPSITGDN